MKLAAIAGAIQARIFPAESVPVPPVVSTIVTAPDGSPLDDFQKEQYEKLQAILDKINQVEGPPITREDFTMTTVAQLYRRGKEY